LSIITYLLRSNDIRWSEVLTSDHPMPMKKATHL
jgi:hypothetical protein